MVKDPGRAIANRAQIEKFSEFLVIDETIAVQRPTPDHLANPDEGNLGCRRQGAHILVRPLRLEEGAFLGGVGNHRHRHGETLGANPVG